MATGNDDAARQALRTLLRQIADEDLPDLIAQARQQARQRVVAKLTDALTEEMLHAADVRPASSAQLHQPASPAPPAPPAPAASPPGEAHHEAPATGPGLYVLCVTAAGTPVPADLHGIGTEPPYAVEQGELAAVVCQVPLGDFEEEQLRENLQDLAWLERTARAHEAVLERICDDATLIPMRLCTVYRSEARVREMLMREQQPLSEALARLENKREWGVKVFAAEGAPPDDPEEPPQDGTGYMLRRAQERDRRSHHEDRLHDIAEQIHERLSLATEAALSNPPQRPEVTCHPGQMILNGVYLVEDSHLDEFLALVDELREQHSALGLELESTGPWPAYNFIPGTIGAAW